MNIGYEKVKHILKEKAQERAKLAREEYVTNPRLCKECGETIPYEKRNDNSFCNSSCSAIHNNKKNKTVCASCGGKKNRHTKELCYICSRKQQKVIREDKAKLWAQGLYDFPLSSFGNLPSPIRRYLLEKHKNACEECGWDKIHPISGKPLVQVDHTDGNWKNNKIENLKVLCPNCHSLSPFNGNMNKGRGRPNRHK